MTKAELAKRQNLVEEFKEVYKKVVCGISVVNGKPLIGVGEDGDLKVIEENFPKPKLDPNLKTILVSPDSPRQRSTTMAEIKVYCPKCNWTGRAADCFVRSRSDRYLRCPQINCETEIKIMK